MATVSLISSNVALIISNPTATHCTGAVDVNHRLLAVCRWRCSTCCSSPARTAPRRATWCTARTAPEPRARRWLEWWCLNSIALRSWWGPTTASRWSVGLFSFFPSSSSYCEMNWCIEVSSVGRHQVAVSCIITMFTLHPTQRRPEHSLHTLPSSGQLF